MNDATSTLYLVAEGLREKFPDDQEIWIMAGRIEQAAANLWSNIESYRHRKEHLDEQTRKRRVAISARCSAALLGTIHSDLDYARMAEMAHRHGLAGVHEWIAHEATQQANALITLLTKE